MVAGVSTTLKAKRPNKCKHFDFSNADIFRQDENGNFAEYKSREIIKQSGELKMSERKNPNYPLKTAYVLMYVDIMTE